MYGTEVFSGCWTYFLLSRRGLTVSSPILRVFKSSNTPVVCEWCCGVEDVRLEGKKKGEEEKAKKALEFLKRCTFPVRSQLQPFDRATVTLPVRRLQVQVQHLVLCIPKTSQQKITRPLEKIIYIIGMALEA